MAIFEDSGTLKYKDKAGNLHIMKPRTTSGNVEGLTQLLAEKENSGAAAKALENAKTYTDQNISGKLDKPANDATATAGQLLTKTANGQEWKDREKATFIVTLVNYTEVDKTVAEIKAARDAGRVCFLMSNRELYPLFAVDDTEAIFAQSIMGDGKTIVQYMITVDADGNVSIGYIHSQKPIEATGLLKGNGNGGISSATAGTDYVAPNGDASNVTAAFTAASTRANITTGEKLSVLFGKIAKWFTDLGSLAFKSTVAKSDLASDVQTSLGKADSALQTAPVTSVNGKTGAVTVSVPTVPSTTSLIKGNGSGGLVAATRGSDYIASGNIVKQTLVATETTPTENYEINWVYG